MSRGGKMAAGVAVIVIIGGSLSVVFLVRPHRTPLIMLKGAVVRLAAQPDKELPIANVKITAVNGLAASHGKSDSSGFFMFALPKGTRPDQPLVLQFRHPDYHPLNLNIHAGDKLYVARMAPIPQQRDAEYQGPQTVVSNISVRYSERTTTLENVGSEVKTFQVVNIGNVPCNGREPCSPDGKWKAAMGSASLDAGTGNVFRNARVSCIAGPCPFTTIKPLGFSQGGRVITVTALNWSGAATFLVEAEVFHPMVSDTVRQSYPVIFGRALNFTVPSTAEGVCLEAEVKGVSIVFPLGPDLMLHWATCSARVSPNQTMVYLCQLKPGYRF
ncbi:MAG: carboxypeptidase regulatory-like domain-containing protein [Terriglobia bacterium]